MRTKHARKIAPYAGSGRNMPGYSRPPAPPQQPLAAPQCHDDDSDFDTIDLGTPKAHSLVHRLAAQCTAAKWGPLPSIPNGHPVVRVRVGGVPVDLPAAWEVSIRRSTDGIETAYGLADDGVLHLVMLRRDGTPAEIIDMPPHVLDHLREWAFPGSAS